MITAWFARLSTGIKMLLILSGALLPLGMIALFASLESAQTNRLTREAEALLTARNSSNLLAMMISRDTMVLREAIARLPADGAATVSSAACRRTLDAAAAAQKPAVAYALFDRAGHRICATSGFSAAPARQPSAAVGTEVRIIPDRGVLRFTFMSGQRVGVGEFATEALVAAAHPRLPSGSYELTLRQGDAALRLGSASARGLLGETVTVIAPVVNGQFALELTMSATPLQSLEILMVVLPLLMWLAAAVTGWLVVDRLLLRPLARMQRAIAEHKMEEGPLVLPALSTPAQELRGLGEAFESAAAKLAAHEAQLEEGLARQTRLTREVHHRVKNNLQVVASLINLHARGASTEEASDAYATIQRRVDALAVVHRNHYAELEENQGVGLRSLIGELASNLRATAPANAQGMTIAVEIMPVYASQDVAVPVAFLITELVELAMACDPHGTVTIRMQPGSEAGKARMILDAPGLTASACLDHPSLERFNRVIGGLARQLRTELEHDPDSGTYAIDINVTMPVAA